MAGRSSRRRHRPGCRPTTPPAFFWLLGRAADLAGVAPWKMLKYGLVAAGFLIPVISYLLWRRLVAVRVAALISAVPLVVPELYESYGWIVLVAIVPWWLEAVHGLTRPGLRPRHPVVLGLIGSALFFVYYYYFFVFVIVFAVFLAVERWRGEFGWRRAGRGLGCWSSRRPEPRRTGRRWPGTS